MVDGVRVPKRSRIPDESVPLSTRRKTQVPEAQVAVATGVCFEWLATGRGPMRPAGTGFESATQVWDFARDELEKRLLESIRRLS